MSFTRHQYLALLEGKKSWAHIRDCDGVTLISTICSIIDFSYHSVPIIRMPPVLYKAINGESISYQSKNS